MKFRVGFLSLMLVLTCFVMSVGFCVLNTQCFGRNRNNLVLAEGSSDLNWLEIKETKFLKEDDDQKLCLINSPGQLAYMNYVLSNPDKDYSGYTFRLESDIYLNNLKFGGDESSSITPLWTPIDNKFENIVFDGNGYSIVGMKIDNPTATNVGFFSKLVGGVFKNVKFVDPIINYSYLGENVAVDVPFDVSVGVVAGIIDSTYVNNVTIENPTVNFNTKNLNGHNFYVGGAVGKLSFNFAKDADSGNKKTINTITPTKWGLDTVNITKTSDSASTGVSMQILEDTVETCGLGVNGYLGGLVGANISSKIINSTLQNIAVNPVLNTNISEKIGGAYYVGGLAGLTTQIAKNENLIVASGLYNNYISNVVIGDESENSENYFGGKLVGRIYSGAWVYNNVVVGSDMSYENLWGDIATSRIRFSGAENCISQINGGLNEYFLNGNNLQYPNCLLAKESIDGEAYCYCSTHNESSAVLKHVDAILENNFYFESDAVCVAEFLTQTVTLNDEEYLRYELLNSFEEAGTYDFDGKVYGTLYYALLPIINYETGLTIDANSTDDSKRIEALSQFRTWKIADNALVLGDVVDLSYTVTFFVNAPTDPKSEAYLEVGDEKYVEYVTGKTYQLITDPGVPVCPGYEFAGWRVPGSDTNYVFGTERITEAGRVFYAAWNLKEYSVFFMLGEDVTYASDTVYFGSTISKPTGVPESNNGGKFVGWFLKEDLPAEGENPDKDKAWIFEADGYSMPANDLELYAGWSYDLTELRLLLSDSDYLNYYDYAFQGLYFVDTLAKAFYDAYTRAKIASDENNAQEADQLIADLQIAFNALRIDVEKITALPILNESLLENICPFLYDQEYYAGAYASFKRDLNRYLSDVSVYDIESFVEYYDRSVELFEGLQDNLNPNILSFDEDALMLLNEKFTALNEEYGLLDRTLYSSYSLAKLDAAKIKAQEIWFNNKSSNQNPGMRAVELAVAAYESALNNLKPVSAPSDDEENDDESNSVVEGSTLKASSTPIIIGCVVMGVLFATVAAFIVVDIMIRKRRAGGKVEKAVKPKKEKEKTKKEEKVQPKAANHVKEKVQVQVSKEQSVSQPQVVNQNVEEDDDEEYV